MSQGAKSHRQVISQRQGKSSPKGRQQVGQVCLIFNSDSSWSINYVKCELLIVFSCKKMCQILFILLYAALPNLSFLRDSNVTICRCQYDYFVSSVQTPGWWSLRIGLACKEQHKEFRSQTWILYLSTIVLLIFYFFRCVWRDYLKKDFFVF